MSKYKSKYATEVNIDAEAQELSFGDIANNFISNLIKEAEKPFVDKILELGYTLEQLKAGELNDIFSMHVREHEVKGELWRKYCLVFKEKEVICKAYKI